MKNRNNTRRDRLSREFRHIEALERQQAREERSPEAQVSLLDQRPGESRRERERLTR